jgi:hypothetical protein
MSEPLFVVLDCLGHSVIDETPDLQEALSLCKEQGGMIAILARGPWFTALLDFIEKNSETAGRDAARADWKAERMAVNRRCEYCGRKVNGKNSTVDHRVPRIRGGADEPENWALSCNGCNQSKGILTVEEFRERIMSAAAFVECEPMEAA